MRQIYINSRLIDPPQDAKVSKGFEVDTTGDNGAFHGGTAQGHGSGGVRLAQKAVFCFLLHLLGSPK